MESGGVVDGGHGGGVKAQPEKEGRLCHFGFSEQQTFACPTDIVQPSSQEEISEHPLMIIARKKIRYTITSL